MAATAPTPDPPGHVLDLGYTRPPLSANEKLNRHAEARLVEEVRVRAGWLARAARIPAAPHLTVELLWRPGVRRRRDGAENITPTLKPVIDGLVDAGLVPDDTPEFVTRVMPGLLPVEGPRAAGMWLFVTPGPAPASRFPRPA